MQVIKLSGEVKQTTVELKLSFREPTMRFSASKGYRFPMFCHRSLSNRRLLGMTKCSASTESIPPPLCSGRFVSGAHGWQGSVLPGCRGEDRPAMPAVENRTSHERHRRLLQSTSEAV